MADLGKALSAADLLPAGDEVQQIWLGVPHFITQALGGSQPAKHAAAHNGILLPQAAAAVNGTHTPHLHSRHGKLIGLLNVCA